MKIRGGYVSNSSSSSFVIIFPKDPKSSQELELMLFGGPNKKYKNPWGDEVWTSKEISEYVWERMQKSGSKNNVEKAAKEFRSDGKWDTPEYEASGLKKFNEFFNVRKKKLLKLSGKPIEEVFYCLWFADEESQLDGAIEHGNLFDKLEYRRFSHH